MRTIASYPRRYTSMNLMDRLIRHAKYVAMLLVLSAMPLVAQDSVNVAAPQSSPASVDSASAAGAMSVSPDATQSLTPTTEHRAGGEANLIIPDLSSQSFFGMSGKSLLSLGLIVCVLGLIFGMV
ncbi:MAG: hypothetical protein H0U64_01380, partial [Gemmatimonadaceae bacterium]|nr:hypothetical protein [Gemmatimonadaceae bacterium]